MDLSAYLSLAIILDKPNGQIRLVDNSAYPAGVAVTLKGNFTSIVQPDGISVGNTNFASPDVSWNGAALTQATYELRTNTVGGFQKGGYSITYTVKAPGYDDTTIIKTFNLNYQQPTAVITANLNNFLPNLSVQDSTLYAMSGFNLVGITDVWSAVINNVNGTVQNISGSGLTFSLAYTGLFYDANFNVTLNSTVSWTLINPDNWVTIIDSLSITQSFDSETPPSLVTLLGYMTFLKAQVDAAKCDCNTYPALLANYLLAMAVYTHLRYRGCNADYAGLSSYVYQLQKIFNNNVTPAVVHTDLPIPAYDWGCGGAGTVSWNNITGKPTTVIIQWTVGDAGFPANGATSITDARLVGFNVWILRNEIQELRYTKALGSGTINFNVALTTGEQVYIQSVPL